jgi:hypothetical protein
MRSARSGVAEVVVPSEPGAEWLKMAVFGMRGRVFGSEQGCLSLEGFT